MGSCPVCNSEVADQITTCPVCQTDLDSGSENKGKWLILGGFEDQISAGLAHETLLNEGFPAVLFSKAGFFGAAGLTMNPFYSSKAGMYEISVPKDVFDEATELVNAILEGQWQPKSKNDQNEIDI